MPQEALTDRFNQLNIKADLPKFVQRGVIHRRNISQSKRIDDIKKCGKLNSLDLSRRQMLSGRSASVPRRPMSLKEGLVNDYGQSINEHLLSL